jgi:two-component system OmpR family sensor kinase
VTTRRRRFGIRARVVATFLVLLITAELVSIAALYQIGANRLEQQVNRDLDIAADDLRVRLESVDATIGQAGGPTLGSVLDEYLRARPARADQAYLTFVGGSPFASSAGTPVALETLAIAPQWATMQATQAGELTTPAGPMRWLAVPIVARGQVLGVLVATEFVGGQRDTLQGIVVTVSLVTLLVLVGGCLLAWGSAGRALRPLHDLASTARSVATGDDLDARLAVESTDEVGELASSFNGMVSRLQVAFDSQKRFLDDAGHELRTPITIVRGHLELLDDDPGQRATEVAVMLDELDRMDRLVSDLRVLARSERPDFIQADRVDLEVFLREIGQKVSGLAPREWILPSEVLGAVRADRHRLTEALLNLVDNAIHVTGVGDPIEITAEIRNDHLALGVRDTGPGIAADDLPTLFARSGRTLPSRPGGTGLGLPIVEAIARAHGGTVAVSSEPAVGTYIEIVVPGVEP